MEVSGFAGFENSNWASDVASFETLREDLHKVALCAPFEVVK